MNDILYIPTDECKYWQEKMAEPTVDFYKWMRNSIEESGIINPLIGIKEGKFVRVRIGNTRLKIAKELGITTVPVILLSHSEEWKKYFDEYTALPVG